MKHNNKLIWIPISIIIAIIIIISIYLLIRYKLRNNVLENGQVSPHANHSADYMLNDGEFFTEHEKTMRRITKDLVDSNQINASSFEDMINPAPFKKMNSNPNENNNNNDNNNNDDSKVIDIEDASTQSLQICEKCKCQIMTFTDNQPKYCPRCDNSL